MVRDSPRPNSARPYQERSKERASPRGGRTVVGLLQDVCYEEQYLRLETGDLLLAYTDGISEAMTADDEEWAKSA